MSDASRDYVWVTDEPARGDVIQNLNLAVSDPAANRTSPRSGDLTRPRDTDARPSADGAGLDDALYYWRGGRRRHLHTFAMPAYQQALVR